MTNIKFGNLEINSIGGSSSVASGVNIPTNWTNFSKSTEGFGKIDGDKNQVKGNVAIVRKPEK
jgi:hypothetical protein